MNTRIKYQTYFEQFVTNGFYPKIVQPCRFTMKTGSVKDHTFCKLSENTSKPYCGILISNMFEEAVFIQLYGYFNKNNLLYESQYWFRTLHSTDLAYLEIIGIIGKDLDNGKLPIGVFLDLSKAFDTLDNTILLDKLLYYGIKGTELAWFKRYLTNRTQFVSYNGTNSHTLSITTGVLHGSILGPLLFIINMNDNHNASSKFHATLFADDTNQTSTLCSFDVNIDNNCNSLQLSIDINKELINIQIWLEIKKTAT